MPHNDRIHLPSWDSQKFVFERYQEDIISQGGEESDVVALRTFYRIWREDFSHVVIPEVWYKYYVYYLYITSPLYCLLNAYFHILYCRRIDLQNVICV